MKLKYKILWIENEQDWVESIEDKIQEYIEDLGFVYDRKLLSKEEQGIDYNLFDLILMDLNLSTQPNGAELITKIRNTGVYTDVVFYSAAGLETLKKEGQRSEFEGVYYSGRTPDILFINKVKKIIDTTIRKVQDLNNLRGLVMAEVSELDVLMEKIILNVFIDTSGNPIEERKKLFEELLDSFEVDYKNNLKTSENNCDKKCFHKIRKKQISEIVTNPFFESYKKARTISKLIEEKLFDVSVKNFLETYKSEIIDVRNMLAHCESQLIDNKEILVTKKGKEEIFDEQRFVEIRKNILKYQKLFEDIFKTIPNG